MYVLYRTVNIGIFSCLPFLSIRQLGFSSDREKHTIITPLKRQGSRDLANEPVEGAGLIFSFDNNNSSTTVRIVRQRIPFAFIIMSRLI